MSAARETQQQQQAEQQSVIDNLHDQLSDVTSQLTVSAANVDRLTTSLTQQSDRADDLQTRLDHAEAQLRTKVGNMHPTLSLCLCVK